MIATAVVRASEIKTARKSYELEEEILALAQFNHLMPKSVRLWRDKIINQHLGLRADLIAHYIWVAKKRGYVQANHTIRQLDQALTAPRYSVARLRVLSQPADIDEEDIAKTALDCSEECKEIFKSHADTNFKYAISLIQEVCESFHIDFPYSPSKNDDEEKTQQKLAGACARCCDEYWWRRRLRKRLGRQVEQVLRSIGQVKKQKQPYLSDWAFKRWQLSQKNNRDILEQMVAENEEGYQLNLADAAMRSISNPAHRRTELLTRMRGYEEIAESMGLVGQFLTLTCPSAYHPRHHHGPRNSKYNSSTPRDAMAYLNSVWAKIRSAWKKKGIRTFGFRVAEPHHAGTPHWHLVLFFSPDQAELAWEIFRKHALAVDGDEPGAQEVRAQRTLDDPSKGSATGYLTKYISKNIDGYKVGIDEEAEIDAVDGAQRVRAWASLWGIRQFQQIGSVSVTVWRELRRRKKVPLEEWEPEEAEEIRQACASGNWARFVELMGGPMVARDDQALRPFHFPESDEKQGLYASDIKRILGVVMRGTMRVIRTRLHVWTIKQASACFDFKERAPPVPLDLCQ